MVDGMAGVELVELACGGMQSWKRLCAAQRCSPMPWAAATSSTAALAVGMAHSSCNRDRVFGHDRARIMLWSRSTAHRSVLTQFVLLVAQLVHANRGRPRALENNEIGLVLRDT